MTALDLTYAAHDGAAKIVRLDGLENFSSLTELSIYGNAVESLSPIAHLPSLTKLNAGCNRIVSFDLSQAPALAEADFSDNPLAGDVSLASYRSLRKVCFNRTSVETLSFSHMSALAQIEAVTCDKLYRITLESCPELLALDAHASKVAGIYFTDVPKLSDLVLADCDLVSHTLPLFSEEFPALAHLDVSGNNARREDGSAFFDVLDLTFFPSLEELRISNTLFDRLIFTSNPKLKMLDAENMERLVRIDLRNGCFPDGAQYRIVEGNDALEYVVVDDGAEQTYAASLFATKEGVTVTTDPQAGLGGGGFLPLPAPTDRPDDADQNPESVGTLMFFPEFSLYGAPLSDVQAYESEKGELREELTTQTDDHTAYVYYVGSEKISYRVYYVDNDNVVDYVATYSPRPLLLVLKDGKWIVNPNFSPVDNSYYQKVAFEAERDGFFYFTASKPACRLAVRAVTVGEEELAEIVFTKI